MNKRNSINRLIRTKICRVLQIFNRTLLRILLIAVPITVAGCSINVKDVELPTRFIDNASEYNIAGTNKFFDDKHLNFGPYQTRNNKQGNREFQESRSLFTKKKTASQEISFTMSNGNALRSTAEAVGLVFKERGSWLDVWLEDEWWYQSPAIDYENFFAGTINIVGDKEYWFYIPQAYSSSGRIEDAVSGYIYSADTNDTDALRIGSHQTQFEGVVWLQNTDAFLLYREENIIAALQPSHPLKIWISNDASETDQFLAANLMGLMVFRQDLITN